MRSLSARSFGVFALLALGLAGCGSKFDAAKTFEIDPSGDQMLLVDAPRSNQKVVAAATTSGAAVDLYIIQAETDVGAREAITKKSPNVLASKLKAVDPTVEANVPAGKGYAVVVANNTPKQATVKLVVTGR